MAAAAAAVAVMVILATHKTRVPVGQAIADMLLLVIPQHVHRLHKQQVVTQFYLSQVHQLVTGVFRQALHPPMS